jgi:hypothetical protein
MIRGDSGPKAVQLLGYSGQAGRAGCGWGEAILECRSAVLGPCRCNQSLKRAIRQSALLIAGSLLFLPIVALVLSPLCSHS